MLIQILLPGAEELQPSCNFAQRSQFLVLHYLDTNNNVHFMKTTFEVRRLWF